MQNTLIFEKSNPLQQLVGLARNMALPHEYAPTRFPSFPALERTAVIGFNVPTTIAIASGSPTRALLSRQAAYPLWVDHGAMSAIPWAYQVAYTGNVALRLPMYAPVDMDTVQITQYAVGPRVRADPVFAGLDGVVPPPGGYPILAMDAATGEQPWVYVPAGATLLASLWLKSGVLPATDPQVKFEYQVWEAPGVARQGVTLSLGYVSGDCCLYTTAVLSTTSWIRPRRVTATASFTEVAATYGLTLAVISNIATLTPATATLAPLYTAAAYPGNGATTTGDNTPLTPIGPPPEFTTSVLPYSSTRTTAAAVLFTNVTKALNKEGTVMCGRLNPMTKNVFGFNVGDLTGLHPAEKQQLGLETGLYTFCPPSTDLTGFWDYSLDPGAICPVYRLDNNSLVNCVSFSDPDGGTTLAVNLDWHLEFRTTSALWQIALSTIPIEVLHQAQLSLVAGGFFFPNETHTEVLKKILPSIKRAATQLLPMVAELHPALKTAYKVSKKISSASRQGAKPTVLAVTTKADSKKKSQPPKTNQKGKGKGKR